MKIGIILQKKIMECQKKETFTSKSCRVLNFNWNMFFIIINKKEKKLYIKETFVTESYRTTTDFITKC